MTRPMHLYFLCFPETFLVEDFAMQCDNDGDAILIRVGFLCFISLWLPCASL
jgi:hypothetical protein